MKESDPIKKYIDQNREGFDDKKVPAGLWEAIEKELPVEKTQRMVPLRSVLRIAAGVAVVLGLAGVIWVLSNQENPRVLAAEEREEKVEAPTVYERYPQLADAEFYYASRIDDLQDELKTFEISEEDYESLALLENELLELKDELGDEVSNEELIQAMMQIYQYKLEMLENMLNQVKGNKKENIRKDEVQVVTL